ncbi:MAG: hypothetical protein IPK25_15825 [Saprospiraceae bacterium]|nr:hypothetical protein [Saprospiraceae bacterium]
MSQKVILSTKFDTINLSKYDTISNTTEIFKDGQQEIAYLIDDDSETNWYEFYEKIII